MNKAVNDKYILRGLRKLEDWLKLPGDNRPSAGALAIRIEFINQRPCNYRRLAQLLSAAGLAAYRKEGTYGYSREDLLKAIQPNGAIALLEKELNGGE